METIKISNQMSEPSIIWAYISLVSILVFLILLRLLHVLKSDLNPIWHMVSEYAIGRHGWMMQLAFGCLAISCVSIAIASFPQVLNTRGKIGMILLVIAAIGLTIAAFNNTDPVNTPKTQMSTQGNMHGLGFMIGVPTLTIAVLLISRSLRSNQNWGWAGQLLLWSAQLPWISIIIMVATLLILLPKNGGKFGPSVFIGLPNRLWVFACCVWIIIIAYGIIKLKKEQTGTAVISKHHVEKNVFYKNLNR